MIRLFILHQGCVYDLDANTVTEGDVTLPLHADWAIFSDDNSEAWTAAWQQEPDA